MASSPKGNAYIRSLQFTNTAKEQLLLAFLQLSSPWVSAATSVPGGFLCKVRIQKVVSPAKVPLC